MEWLTNIRWSEPERVAEALASRRRRARPLNGEGRLFLLAADHTARGTHRVGENPYAMADRSELLKRLRIGLERPHVDGVMATADIIEDLALLGVLDGKVVFGSMNRGGLDGSAFELDDRFTGYTASAVEAAGLDGGKMMVRIDDRNPATVATLSACGRAIDELAQRRLLAMVEVFSMDRQADRGLDHDAARLARAATIASGLGSTSAYTWLKVPVVEDMSAVAAATTLPLFLLGGDPGPDAGTTYRRWEKAMALPQVRGLVAGRTLLYPADGDVARSVDAAADVVTGS